MEQKYSRGSEWCKWDLHVHTPLTKLNDQYKDDTADSVWDKYCDEIEKSDVLVFGITDYFSVDNYFEFLNKFKTKYPESKKVFFPNIELRLNVSVNKNAEEVNTHIILDNKLDSKKVKNFLDSLKTNIHNTDDISKKCTDLVKNDFSSAAVSLEDIKKCLEATYGNNECYLIFTAANNDGLRADDSSGRKMNISDNIDRESDVFFGGKTNVEYFLKTDRYEDKSNRSKPKPTVSSCDAHSFDDLTNKLGKEYSKTDDKKKICDSSQVTWIKANPTFEGLKQIIYEPEDRVSIQNEKPEQKPADKIIDSVQFKHQDFTANKILLNQNLTVIIGGKSTGKSILLKKIAQIVDKKQVQDKTQDLTQPNVDKVELEVLWKDKKPNHEDRKIIYIPQSYLNRLADKHKSDEIVKIVDDTLKQEAEIKEFFNSLRLKQNDIQSEIERKINDLFAQKENNSSITDSIKSIGVELSIEEMIKKLEQDIAAEKLKVIDVTDSDLTQYNKLREENIKFNAYRVEYESDIKILQKIKTKEIFSEPQYMGLSDKIAEEVKESFSKLKNTYLSEWKKSIDNKMADIKNLIVENNAKIKKNNKAFTLLQEKVKKSTALHHKIEELDAEKKRLNQLKNENKKLKEGQTLYNKLLNNIIDLHISFFDLLTDFKVKILNQQTIIVEKKDLKFDINVEFDSNIFFKDFLDKYINLGKRNSYQSFLLKDIDHSDSDEKEWTNYNFTAIDTYKRHFLMLVQKDILQNDATILKGKDAPETILKRATNNWFKCKYQITYKGDEISKMSPGKRSFVLLKLLIELDSTNKCPILLDQPEDDLDNRSIFNELAKFIKDKKKDRQIIITTHNPNLAVGTDAECVIVANQHGDETKNKKHTFEYVQGALENTYNNKDTKFVLDKYGIQEHVCDILEGGKIAFEKRRKKYNFKS